MENNVHVDKDFTWTEVDGEDDYELLSYASQYLWNYYWMCASRLLN